MHTSVIDFVRNNIHSNMVSSKAILEVGSYDVNGTVRPFIEAYNPSLYVGVDMRSGPGVDIVLDVMDLPILGKELFDIVFCLEMLEHAKDWKQSLVNMFSVLKKDGLLILTTRSPGFPLHDYPSDHWRFTQKNMADIFDGLIPHIQNDYDEFMKGVFVIVTKFGDLPNLDNIIVMSMEL